MRKRKLKLGVVIGLVMTAVLIVVAGCAGPAGPSGPSITVRPEFEKPTAPELTDGVVEATWITVGPAIDAIIEPVWDKATELKITVDGSFHDVKTTGAEVTVKFLYNNEYIYTLVQYPDSTVSFINMSHWLWDDETGWYELESIIETVPEPWFEDDMMGIMWNINTPEFEERGCATKCHVIYKGEEVQIPFDILPETNALHVEGVCRDCHDADEMSFNPAGGYLPVEGQYIDMWMERTNRVMPMGFSDDWHWKKPRPGYPHGGRFADEGAAIYYNNQSRIQFVPLYMETNPADYFDAMNIFTSEIALGEAVAVNGLTDEQISEYWDNYQALKVPVPTEYPNALVPQRIMDDFALAFMPDAQLLGDRWDVVSAGEWMDGIWTFEYARKLVTGQEVDVQFDDFTKVYSFQVMISNAGGEYISFQAGPPAHLVFAPPGEEVAPIEEEVAPPEVTALPPILFSVQEGEMELIGDDLAPYGADLTTPNQYAPWTMIVEKGSTIPITQGGSGYYSVADHTISIKGTDIDIYLPPQASKGPFEVTFDEAGIFEVYCKLHPADEHGGGGRIIVTEGGVLPPGAEAPWPPLPLEEGALPPIELKMANNYIQFVGDDLTPYGEGLVSPLHSEQGPWTVTVKKGSTITVTEVSMSGNPATLDHNLIIEGTDFDVYLSHGETAGPFEVTFDEVGTFKVYCKLHPDDHGGEALIVVTE